MIDDKRLSDLYDTYYYLTLDKDIPFQIVHLLQRHLYDKDIEMDDNAYLINNCLFIELEDKLHTLRKEYSEASNSEGMSFPEFKILGLMYSQPGQSSSHLSSLTGFDKKYLKRHLTTLNERCYALSMRVKNREIHNITDKGISAYTNVFKKIATIDKKYC